MSDHFLCRSCRSSDVSRVLDLGLVPGSDVFPYVDDGGPDPTWPLELYFCTSCALAQLGPDGPNAVDEQGAAESATALSHARASVDAILAHEELGSEHSIIEIDSGHGGSWLPHFEAARLTAREPVESADVVVDLHGLMHEPDLDQAMAAHTRRMLPGGRLICEFYYLGALVAGSLIDTIRHGHFSYLSVTALTSLAERHGLVVCHAEHVAMFGGSMRATLRRAADAPTPDASVRRTLDEERRAALHEASSLHVLGQRGRAAAEALRDHLEKATKDGTSIAGYGAPSKAAVLLALSRVDNTQLPYTVDISPGKHGRRIPGAHVPIRSVDALVADRPDEIVVLTWDIVGEIVSQIDGRASSTDWKPRYWVPLPEPGYVQ